MQKLCQVLNGLLTVFCIYKAIKKAPNMSLCDRCGALKLIINVKFIDLTMH